MGGLGVCTGVCFVDCMNWLWVASFTYPDNGASALLVVFSAAVTLGKLPSMDSNVLMYHT
jgi:hypothetical protein